MCSNEFSSLPWSDDASKHEVGKMRWVCVNVCPSRLGCERNVEDDLAAGRVIAGFRAGVSLRARTRRLAVDGEPNALRVGSTAWAAIVTEPCWVQRKLNATAAPIR